jgi:hypothetical protein
MDEKAKKLENQQIPVLHQALLLPLTRDERTD